MENTPRETAEEPVLLSWEMPARQRWSLIVDPFFIAIFVALGVNLLSQRVPDTWQAYVIVWLVTKVALVTALGLLVFRPAFTSARWLVFTGSGLEIRTIIGRKERFRWGQVRALKRVTWLRAAITTDTHTAPIYLPVPSHVLDKLIAILRETSNARIIGFDSETT